ncbi:leukocyte cysteine proteinase inhibitor 1-like [Mercenaria mercenaria]|uniref:leukocyte cysteine proteinase inhibitor 1-like n=1 Tax=Mercenaria mercenaria TaxID=6596 RepID=UPI00234F82C0|nr:leukocyte cysteine proteinase inhibitor 1-like [Mercenaria mercenaria]
MDVKTGAWTGEENATPEVQEICDKVKDQVGKMTGVDSFEMYNALKYRSQIVAGTNYCVKIQINSAGDCDHVKIFQALPSSGGKLQVEDVQTKKTIPDPIQV